MRSLDAWATTVPNTEELVDPRNNQECEQFFIVWTLWKPMGEPIAFIINTWHQLRLTWSIYTRVYTHANIYAHVRKYRNTHIYITILYTRAYNYTYTHTHTHTYVYIYICVYIYMYFRQYDAWWRGIWGYNWPAFFYVCLCVSILVVALWVGASPNRTGDQSQSPTKLTP